MTTEATEKNRISEISHNALSAAAESSEAYTRITAALNDDSDEAIRLRIVEPGLSFEAASPTLLVAAMIDALAAKELIIWDLQSQIDALRTGSSDNE